MLQKNNLMYFYSCKLTSTYLAHLKFPKHLTGFNKVALYQSQAKSWRLVNDTAKDNWEQKLSQK